MRVLVLASALLAVAALAGAGWLAYRDRPAEPPALAFREPVADVGRRPKGTKVQVPLVLVNTSSRPRQVVRFAGFCRGAHCISGPDDPVTVPPHAEVSYVVEVTIDAPGPFEIETVLYVDDGGLRALPVVVRGVAE